ncbi:MAG TPA: nuclear transport factor 2 family protein [Synergistaceae bacterium]|nr:nuclear transport factor 2 family protein [Synergistaceae bacterium]HPJ25968.1 nuclear transport factor 2 family protein [Synergistaceae bacterium]HPQ37662.1 nuclear transport factor 2 family protein [Synergistaceae bacterium]
MERREKERMIEKYVEAYNTFDVEGMMNLLHPDVLFCNLFRERITVATRGKTEFRSLAEHGATLFRSRKQEVLSLRDIPSGMVASIHYKAELAADLPNGMKVGECMDFKGTSEFMFKDGLLCSITYSSGEEA